MRIFGHCLIAVNEFNLDMGKVFANMISNIGIINMMYIVIPLLEYMLNGVSSFVPRYDIIRFSLTDIEEKVTPMILVAFPDAIRPH